ncbi:MAG: hypothetical protein J6X97_08440 [Lachnospiraceae bacterium]|nr:hypothetical protein [Lachnospiraceae bacterium]
MSKRFGVSVAFISAFAFFCGWYDFRWLLIGTILVLLLAGEEEKLKKNVLNAFFLSFILLIANMVLSWISRKYLGMLIDLSTSKWDWVSNIMNARIAKTTVYTVFTKLDLAGFIVSILGFVEFVLMIIFVILSLLGKEVKVPVANGLALKAMGLVQPKEKKEKAPKKEEKAAEETEENPITSDKATLTDIPENEK